MEKCLNLIYQIQRLITVVKRQAPDVFKKTLANELLEHVCKMSKLAVVHCNSEINMTCSFLDTRFACETHDHINEY